YRGLRRVDVAGAPATPDAQGHVTFTVALGPPDTDQENTPGATTTVTTRTVSLAPYAVIRIARVHVTHGRVRFCARAAGGPVSARGRLGRVSRRLTLTARTSCRTIRRPATTRARLVITGTDRFGHRVSARRTVRAG